jgi:hypothetical protein
MSLIRVPGATRFALAPGFHIFAPLALYRPSNCLTAIPHIWLNAHGLSPKLRPYLNKGTIL